MLKKFFYLAITFIIFNILNSANHAMSQEDIEESGYNKNILHPKSSIEKSFLDFCQSDTRSPVDTLHIIQAEDFDTGHYRFHYRHQESYRSNVKSPHYPRYTPIGSIRIMETSPLGQGFLLTAEWMTEDNPSPGINTTFQMSFCVYPKLIIPDELPLTVWAYSPEKALSFVRSLGYDGDTFSLETFSFWFRNRYLGFTKDDLGFYPQNAKPIVYNGEAFSLVQYLDISNEYFVFLNPLLLSHLPPDPAHIPDPILWLATRVKDIYSSLQQESSFISTREDSVIRRLLTIGDRELRFEMSIADEIDNKIYAISPNNHFYIQGNDWCHHPDLLKGGFAWCAGHISIKKGKITFLSNNSGHYRPSLYHFYTFVKKLKSEELFEEDAELNACDFSRHNFSVDNFLQNFDESFLQEQWKREINERIHGNRFLEVLFTY